MKQKELKLIYSRCMANQPTASDKKLLSPFAKPGENVGWPELFKRYFLYLKKQKEQQMDMFTSKGLMFPFKGDDSAVPKQILRGSLFAPISRGRRKGVEDKLVAVFDGGHIKYTGLQLDQNDLDILMELTKLLSEFSESDNVEKIRDESGNAVYSRIKFTRYSFLKRLGKSDGKKNYENLKKAFTRLGGVITVQLKGKGVMNRAIIGNSFMTEDGMIAVDINHQYTTLFLENNFSYIDTNIRLGLKGDFTKWLQGFVSSHSGASSYSAEKLIELSDSKMNRCRDFIRLTAKPAFEQLELNGVIKKFSLKGHLFNWVR